MSRIEEGCVLCRLLFDPEMMAEPENEMLFGGQHHYIICGLGAWIPGYLLLVSRDHFDSFARVPPYAHQEFIDMRDAIQCAFETEFGEWCAFEHGAVGGKSQGGACVDHAHLHILGRRVGLVGRLKEMKELELVEPGYIVDGSVPYIFAHESGGKPHTFLIKGELPRQFLRREVAAKLGCAEKWDYRRFPFDENIRETLWRFRGRIRLAGKASI